MRSDGGARWLHGAALGEPECSECGYGWPLLLWENPNVALGGQVEPGCRARFLSIAFLKD